MNFAEHAETRKGICPSRVTQCNFLRCAYTILHKNQYTHVLPTLTGVLLIWRRKSSKKKLKELIWDSRRSLYKIEFIEEGVKKVSNHASPNWLIERPSASSNYCSQTYWYQLIPLHHICRLLLAPKTWHFIIFELRERRTQKRTLVRSHDTNGFEQARIRPWPLDIPLPQRLITPLRLIRLSGSYMGREQDTF